MDAAHGKTVRPIVARKRTYAIGLFPDAGRQSRTAGKRRRGPTTTVHADTRQTSRIPGAVARSRRKRAIAMRNAAEREQVQFTIQNAKFTINGFSSRVRFHRCHSEAKPKNLLISNIHSSSARPGRLRGSHLRCEPAPGARVETLASALPHQRNSRNVGHACRNVMLSESNRRTQRPLAVSASQGGERQTKCSQESMRDNRESDSSSIFRSPQNDELLNCSQTPRQTGICNWRQRGKVEGKDVRGGRGLQR